MWTESQLSWLAGFIEGEGTIRLYRVVLRQGSFTGFGTQLIIANSDEQLIDNIVNIFGATKTIVDPARFGRPYHKIMYYASFRVKDQYRVLSLLLPYFQSKVKREQAEIVLWYLLLRNKKECRSISKGAKAVSQVLYSRSVELHARGRC